MQKFCCEQFQTLFEKHDLVHNHKDKFYYMILYNDMANLSYIYRFCPFCGKRLTSEGFL